MLEITCKNALFVVEKGVFNGNNNNTNAQEI
jgi:hypothetical protein